MRIPLVAKARGTPPTTHGVERASAPLYVGLYLVALAVYAAVAWPSTHPPYIDSFYYVDIARAIARGQGFTETFVWNYLGGLVPLHHPSSAYWLPGLSLLLAPVYLLGGDFHAATLATCAIGALCVPLAAIVARDLLGGRRHALTAAALTLFSGVWFHNWTTPDAWVPFATTATLAFFVAYRGLQGRWPKDGAVLYALAGSLAGACALLRQEGALLLVALLIATIVTPTARRRLWPLGVVGAIALFAVVEAPWVVHTLVVTGRPLSIDGTKTLWMRTYSAFYALHTDNLTPASYLRWGLWPIVGARIQALGFTLATWLVLWLVVLVVPLLVGLLRHWRRLELRPFLIYWAILGGALPLVFTVTLEHGTVGHASGALVPFGAVAIAAGLDTIAVRLAGTRRAERLYAVLALASVALAVIVSLRFALTTFPAHGDEYTRDVRVAAWLRAHEGATVAAMVADPPAFSYIDGRPYVIPPSDGLGAVLSVARHYGVHYWAIDRSINASYIRTLTRTRIDSMHHVATLPGVSIYRIDGGRREGAHDTVAGEPRRRR